MEGFFICSEVPGTVTRSPNNINYLSTLAQFPQLCPSADACCYLVMQQWESRESIGFG